MNDPKTPSPETRGRRLSKTRPARGGGGSAVPRVPQSLGGLTWQCRGTGGSSGRGTAKAPRGAHAAGRPCRAPFQAAVGRAQSRGLRAKLNARTAKSDLLKQRNAGIVNSTQTTFAFCGGAKPPAVGDSGLEIKQPGRPKIVRNDDNSGPSALFLPSPAPNTRADFEQPMGARASHVPRRKRNWGPAILFIPRGCFSYRRRYLATSLALGSARSERRRRRPVPELATRGVVGVLTTADPPLHPDSALRDREPWVH